MSSKKGRLPAKPDRRKLQKPWSGWSCLWIRSQGSSSVGGLLLLGLLWGCAGLVDIPIVFTGTNYVVGKLYLNLARGISREDLKSLDNGDLAPIKAKYASRSFDALTVDQQRLLCDIHIKYHDTSAAFECLGKLEMRLKKEAASADLSAIAGKRALLFLQSGAYKLAADTSRELSSDGARYIYALATVHSGQPDEVLKIADEFQEWSFYKEPKVAFFAANLMLALGQYARALDLLRDPSIGLARDYGLNGPAVLRADIFDEFNFGLFQFFSYAPSSNVYVEFMLAKSLLETEQRNEAKRHFDALISYERIETYRDIHWMSLYERGRIAEMEGDISGAMDFYKRSIGIIETIRSSINTALGRISYVADKQVVYGNLISLLFKNHRNAEAIEYTERARGRVLVDLLSEKKEFSFSPEDAASTSELMKEFLEVDNELLADTANPNLVATRSARQQRLGETLRKTAPGHARLVTAESILFPELKGLVGQDETIVGFYWVDKTERYVYALNRGQEPVVMPIDGQDVDRKVSEFRKAIESPRDLSLAQVRRSAQQLYDALIRPVDAIKFKQMITFLPDGSLHYLPFNALYTGQGFLVEEYLVRVVPSLSALKRLGEAKATGRGALVFGNPLRPDEPELVYAEREAIAVADNSPNARLLLKGDATAEAFYKSAKDYGYVHIASHAAFDQSSPLLSRLLLAAPPYPGDITVNDIFDIKLNAKLVVLSACQTALSYVSEGKELIGLTESFIKAGARVIIGSLWRIDDASTAFLMERFYQALSRGEHPTEALQEAQIKTLREYQHPYFWAAFQLTGL